MNSTRKTRVLIVNMEAGAGHWAFKENLLRTLKENEKVEIKVFDTDVEFYQGVYKNLLRYPRLWYLFRELSDKRPWYFLSKVLAIVPDLKNAETILEDFNPDIVICTNPISSVVYYDLRKTYRLNYKLVTSVCDYGEQRVYLHKLEPADYYLVRDEDTKQILSKYVDANKLLVIGTTVNKVFEEAANLETKELSKRFKLFYKENFAEREIDKKKKNILVIGGSSWTFKSKSLILKLSKTNKYNLFVNCGKDQKLFAFMKNKANIFPFRFQSQETLSIIEKYVDLTIQSSLAPATMHELFTINKYPLFVNRVIKGQESPHVELLSKWNVGFYEPKDDKMIKLIEEYFSNPEKYNGMLENQKRIRIEENRKAKSNYKVIEQIAANL